MTVKFLTRAAKEKITINTVIIWNPNISRALYVGSPSNIPKTIGDKIIKSYRYDGKKSRMIIRI